MTTTTEPYSLTTGDAWVTTFDADMTAHEAARRIQNGRGHVWVFASILPEGHEWVMAVKGDLVATLKRMHPTVRMHLKYAQHGTRWPSFFLSRVYE